jgi:lipopolysaccharide export LptBFGC system permease protein LptF
MKTKRLVIYKKVLLISVIIFFAFAAGGFAQNDGVKTQKTPEEKAKKITDRMNTTLNLTPDQYTKTYNLYLNKIQKREQKMEQMKEARKKENEEFRNSLKGILTDEQYSTLEQKRKEMKEKNGDKKGKKGNKNRNSDGDKPKEK